MFGLNEAQLKGFIERVSATAIANQAILKCKARRLPLTEDNVIFFVGDFFDPFDPEFEGIVDKINAAIGYVVECPEVPSPLEESNDNVIQFRPRARSL